MKYAAIVCFLLVLAGCGVPTGSSGPIGFVNETKGAFTDAELMAMWDAAQASIATGPTQINPREGVFHQGALARFIPGDPKALKVEPRQMRITAKPDVLAAVLNEMFPGNDTPFTDPTHMILCPTTCRVENSVAGAYTLPGVGVDYAESTPREDLIKILTYEFQNQILYMLHYDVKYR